MNVQTELNLCLVHMSTCSDMAHMFSWRTINWLKKKHLIQTYAFSLQELVDFRQVVMEENEELKNKMSRLKEKKRELENKLNSVERDNMNLQNQTRSLENKVINA